MHSRQGSVFQHSDFGMKSCISLVILLMLQIEYPENVHLIRGNHEAADINALFGFRLECIERMVRIFIHIMLPLVLRVLIIMLILI